MFDWILWWRTSSSNLLPTSTRKDSSYNRNEPSSFGRKRRAVMLVLTLLVLFVIVFTLANARFPDNVAHENLSKAKQANHSLKSDRILPVEDFESIQGSWPSLKNLIILPAHAIQWCGEFGMDARDETCWYLEPFQHGQVPLFIEHVRRAIEELGKDPHALLVFSGGQTRPGVGPRSEAQSMVSLAEHLGFLSLPTSKGFDPNLYHRLTTEEFAKDSLENVAFSVCRFRQVTGHLPEQVTVVGFPFKKERFEQLHRRAVGVIEKFSYIGVEVEGIDQSGLVDSAKPAFTDDLFGCGDALVEKRRKRDPYKQLHISMAESCPELSVFFQQHQCKTSL